MRLIKEALLQEVRNRSVVEIEPALPVFALQFNGVNSYVDIPYAINLFDGNNDFSIEAVVKPDFDMSNTISRMVINFANNLYVAICFNEDNPLTGSSDNKLGFWIYDGSHQWVGTSFARNNIYHIVGRYESVARKMSLYVNGVFIGEKTINNPYFIYGGNNRIGMHNRDSKYFDGEISKIRVYDKLLSENEINILNSSGNLNNEFLRYNFIGAGSILPEGIKGFEGTIHGATWVEI